MRAGELVLEAAQLLGIVSGSTRVLRHDPSRLPRGGQARNEGIYPPLRTTGDDCMYSQITTPKHRAVFADGEHFGCS